MLVGGAGDADGFRRKWGGVKELVWAVLRGLKEVDGSTIIVRHIRAVAAAEGGIVALSQCNRETRSGAGNS